MYEILQLELTRSLKIKNSNIVVFDVLTTVSVKVCYLM